MASFDGSKGSPFVLPSLLYHAGDNDLKKVLGALIDQAELEVSECDTLLADNGIASSPAMPNRPEAKLEDIPVGVRFTDLLKLLLILLQDW